MELRPVERDGQRLLEGAVGQPLLRDAGDSAKLVEVSFFPKTANAAGFRRQINEKSVYKW